MNPILDQNQILEEARYVESVRENPAVFSQIYDRYLTPVYRYLLSRVGNAQDAEDLTSQVFLLALERIGQYQERGKSIAAWLFTIARNQSNDHFRRRQPVNYPAEDSARPTQEDDALLRLCRKDETRAIFRLIGQLPEADRELLDLRFGAELTFAEIGHLVGRKEDSVKKQIYRVLERIQEKLEVEDAIAR